MTDNKKHKQKWKNRFQKSQEKKNELSEKVTGFFTGLMDKLESPETQQLVKDYFSSVSQFYNYSFNNTLLVHLQAKQRGVKVTALNSFDRWKKVPCEEGKLSVQRGEKGFKVFVPTPVTKWERDENGEILLDKNGKKIPCRTESGKIIKTMAFSVGNVFDISQTNAAELGYEQPTLSYRSNLSENEASTYEQLKDNIAQKYNMKVKEEAVHPSKATIRGMYSPQNDEITIYTKNASVDNKISTLFHELGHKILHRDKILTGEVQYSELNNRGKVEGEAESFSYILSKVIGIENSSELYIAHWGNKVEDLTDFMKKVTDAAKESIKELGLAKFISNEPNLTKSTRF